MKIFPIISNQLYRNHNMHQKSNGMQISGVASQRIGFDTVCFCSKNAATKKCYFSALKALAEKYGINDMYTDKPMLSSETLDNLKDNGVFEKPLNELIPILKKYEAAMLENSDKVFLILIDECENHPNETLQDVFKSKFGEYQDELLKKQRLIFEKLMIKSGNLPDDYFKMVLDLMRMTSSRLAKDPYVSHFSENDFIFKLKRIQEQVITTQEKKDISSLIAKAKEMFLLQAEEKKKFGGGFSTTKIKYEYQMQPHVCKRNIKNIENLKTMFENSSLKNNQKLIKLFENTIAKIYGLPVIEPFKRQEFIYDLKSALKFIKDKKLYAEMIKIAQELPTSREDISAFFVKHADDTSSVIGSSLLEESLISKDHMVATTYRMSDEDKAEVAKMTSLKKQKAKTREISNRKSGKQHISNYGLCAVGINKSKSNMPFDDYIRKHPQCYETIPKYFNRLVELYREGKFSEVGLDVSYIFEFADTIAEISPAEKRIILDTSGII